MCFENRRTHLYYNETPCFAHGQLYVVLSRVGSFDDVSVFVAHWKDTCVCIHTFDKDVLNALPAGTRLTTNVVYKGILTGDIFNVMMLSSSSEDNAVGTYPRDIINVLHFLLFILKVNNASLAVCLDTESEDQEWGTGGFPQSSDSVLTDRLLFGVHSHS